MRIKARLKACIAAYLPTYFNYSWSTFPWPIYLKYWDNVRAPERNSCIYIKGSNPNGYKTSKVQT